MVLGLAVPLVLLATDGQRRKTGLLALAAALATGGIVLNRMTTVVFGMALKGTAPLTTPQAYFPSTAEWGVSIGLIAATIFLFGLAVRHLPVLPEEKPGH